MIHWDILNTDERITEDKKAKIKICESCEFIGKNSECTLADCKCFVTSIVVENMDCPIHKW